MGGKPVVDSRLDKRVELSLEGASLRWIGEDLGCDSAALFRVGKKLVDDIVGVERFYAQLVKESRKEGFAAGNPPRQGYSHGFS